MSPQLSAKLLGPGPPPCVVAKPWAGTGSSDSYTTGLCLTPSSSHLLAGLGGAVSPAARGSPRSELRPQSCQNGHLLPAALPLRALVLPAPHRPVQLPPSRRCELESCASFSPRLGTWQRRPTVTAGTAAASRGPAGPCLVGTSQPLLLEGWGHLPVSRRKSSPPRNSELRQT